MKKNNRNKEERVLTIEELENIIGGYSVKCIGCGATISAWLPWSFNSKVATHNQYCVLYQKAIRENKTYWGASNVYAYMTR